MLVLKNSFKVQTIKAARDLERKSNNKTVYSWKIYGDEIQVFVWNWIEK